MHSRSLRQITDRTLRRFGFRQTIRGALIIGLLAGVMMGVQGPAYNAAYPSEASRHAFVATLETVPALGFMAGETANAGETASYSIYKSIVIMTAATAVWGLLVTTRLLRGQEEDGRLEVLLAGNTTKRRASAQLLLGFSGALLVSLLIAFVGIAGLGRLPNVELAPGNAALLTLGIYLPGIFFAGLGVATSQLARTRGRAIMYGLIPLFILFAIRGAGNSAAKLDWLKTISPFGWVDRLNPVLAPNIFWILPTIIVTTLCVSIGLCWAHRRDLGDSIVSEPDTARSHYQLLHSVFGLAIRQHVWTFTWWLIGTLALTGLFTGLAKLSVTILKDASGAQDIIAKLGYSAGDITLAFIGIGTSLTAMILLILTILLVARVRRDEARGYLDSILIHTLRRQTWLTGRLGIIFVIITLIAFSSAFLSWFVAYYLQHIEAIQLQSLLLSTISTIAVLLFTLGVGMLIYGLRPRLAVGVMIVVVGWSYLIDALGAVVKLSDIVVHTSLLRYLSSPITTPDWTAVVWLSGIGLAMIAIGVAAFTRRDIISE